MTKIPGRLTGITVSDIHFGVGSNAPSDIARSLREDLFGNFKPDSRAATVDVIVIAGDLFHSDVAFGSETTRAVISLFMSLLEFAAQNNILVILLQGTYSHDRDQSKMLADIAYRLIENGMKVNFAFYDDVAVVKHLGYDMLFVPDNHAPKTSITLAAVKSAMEARGLDQVDLAFMHGTFHFQLKYGSSDHKHDEQEYLALVRHWIMVGHIHTRSVYSRIIAQGSWPRTTHGEEEEKGAVWWRVDKLDGDAYEFINNTQAKIFKTLTLPNEGLEAAMRSIDRLVGKLPAGSAIRVIAEKTHPIVLAFNSLKHMYPFYDFSKKVDNDTVEEGVRPSKALSADDYVPPAINRSNIVEVTMGEVKMRNPLTVQQEERLLRILQNIRVK